MLNKITSKSVFVVFLLCFNLPLFGQSVILDILPGGKITVEGTSTIHDWSVTVNKFTGHAILSKSLARKTLLKRGDFLDSLEIRMAVKSMESGRGPSMDNRTFNALKADEYPEIIFRLKTSKITEVDPSDQSHFKVYAAGDLNIAGVVRPVEMTAAGKRLNGGGFEVSGSKSLTMTEFGVTPPSAMFGQIVAGDSVTIKFEGLTIKGKEQK